MVTQLRRELNHLTGNKYSHHSKAGEKEVEALRVVVLLGSLYIKVHGIGEQSLRDSRLAASSNELVSMRIEHLNNKVGALVCTSAFMTVLPIVLQHTEQGKE